MSDRRAQGVELSSEDAADAGEHARSHPVSGVLRRTDAPVAATLHALLDRSRSEIVARFVRAHRRKRLTQPDAPCAIVIDDLPFFLADLTDALRRKRSPERLRVSRRRFAGLDLGAVLREYSVLRTCILAVIHDGAVTPTPRELAILHRAIDDEMADAALDYAEQRDAELRSERAALEGERLRLAKAVASRDDVLAIVSHDLRNPLTSIALGVDQLRRNNGDAVRRDRILGSVERSVHRMTTLIEDLLAIARIDAGQLSLQLSPCPADALVEEAIAIVRPLADAKAIELETAVAPDVMVYGDRERLLQMLGNLLGNALKFTPEGGTICIVVSVRDRFALFSVRDTGTGIPPESLPHVFDRFYQGPGRRRGGAGLGLAIARAIADAHGGNITIDSAVGRGTNIQFTVPLAESG